MRISREEPKVEERQGRDLTGTRRGQAGARVPIHILSNRVPIATRVFTQVSIRPYCTRVCPIYNCRLPVVSVGPRVRGRGKRRHGVDASESIVGVGLAIFAVLEARERGREVRERAAKLGKRMRKGERERRERDWGLEDKRQHFHAAASAPGPRQHDDV